jgi:Flp pilus assembly pilin Flp
VYINLEKGRYLVMTWENVTGAVTNLMSVVSTVVSSIIENPLLAVLVAVPVVGAGCVIFKKLIRAAK